MSGLLLLHGVGGTPEKATAGLPVQVHTMNGDEFATPEEIAEWSQAMDRFGARYEVFRYDGGGHLYTDADLPDYHGAAAELTWERSMAFLATLTP